MSCYTTPSGKESILHKELEASMGADMGERLYKLTFSPEFKRSFGDWEKYASLSLTEEGRTGKEYMDFVNSGMVSKTDANGEPLLAFLLDFMESDAGDVSLAVIKRKATAFSHLKDSIGVNSFIDEEIAQKRDSRLYPFSDEGYLSGELSRKVRERGIDPTSEEASRILEELKGNLFSWKRLAEQGTELHDIARKMALDPGLDSLERWKEAGNGVPDFMEEDQFSEYLSNMGRFLNGLRKRGRILPEQELRASVMGTALRGIADIVLVLEDGSLEVYDFKFSVKGFEGWNESKDIKVQYQLQMYENMLRSYGLRVNAKKAVSMTISGDPASVSEPSEIDLGRTKGLYIGNPIYDTVQDLIPVGSLDSFRAKQETQDIVKAMKDLFNVDVSDFGLMDFKDFKKEHFRRYVNKQGKKMAYTETAASERKIYLNPALLEDGREKELEAELYRRFSEYQASAGTKAKMLESFISEVGKSMEGRKALPKLGDSYADLDSIIPYIVTLHKEGWVKAEFPELEELGIVAMKRDVEGKTLLRLIAYTEGDLDEIHDFGIKGSLAGGGREFITGKLMKDYRLRDMTSSSRHPRATRANMEGLKAVLWTLKNHSMFGKEVHFDGISVISGRGGFRGISFENMQETLSAVKGSLPDSMSAGLNKDYGSNYALEYLGYLQSLLDNPESMVGMDYRKLERFKDETAEIVSEIGRKHWERGKLIEVLEGQKKDLDKIKRAGGNVPESLIRILSSAIVQLKGMGVDGISDLASFGNLVGESYWLSTVGEIGEKAVKRISFLANQAIYYIRYRFNALLDEARPRFEELFQAKGFTGLRRNLVGDSGSVYANMIQFEDSEGEVSMKIKPDSELNEIERKFANYFLSKINDVRTQYMNDEQRALFLASDDARNIPLIPASEFSRFRGMNPVEAVGQFFARHFSTEDIMMQNKEYRDDLEAKTRIGNVFAYKDKGQARKDYLAGKKAGEFEYDLQLVLYTYMITEFKKDEFNQVLPEMDSIKHALMHKGERMNAQLENLERYINGYLDTAVYNRPELSKNPTERKLEKGAIMLQKLTTWTQLGLSPLTGLTQVFQGLYANTIQVMASTFLGEDAPSAKEYLKAAGIVLGEESTSPAMQVKTESLNELYAISAMDLQYMAQKTAERKGIVQFFTRWAFWMNSAPDYFNRMKLFVAQMIHDGTWDAHSVVDGRMHYDARKDRRFSEYLAGNKSHPEYAKQEAYYQWLMGELAKEPEGTKVMDGKAYPARAYSFLQVKSINAYSDKVHGAYNHEDKQMLAKNAFGRLLLQFRAGWLKSKINRYFLSPGTEELIGKVEFQEGPNGEMVPVWTKERAEGIFHTLLFIGREIFASDGLVAGMQKTLSLGEDLKPHQKKNLLLLAGDLALFGSLYMIYEALEEELEKDRSSYKSMLFRSMFYASKDLFVLNNLGIAFDQNPIVAISFLRRAYETTFSVITGEKDPAYMLQILGATRPMYYMMKDGESKRTSNKPYSLETGFNLTPPQPELPKLGI